MPKSCAVPECGEKVPDWALTCIRHWRALPKELKDAVNRTLRAYKANISIETAEAYRDAVAAAIAELTPPPKLDLF